MSSYKYVLYAHPVAQPSRAIIWMAALCGFEYELKVMMPNLAGEHDFIANVSPLGTLPALVINDKDGNKVNSIGDSIAIASYIADVSGEKGNALFPKDPLVRAKVIQQSLFATTINRNVSTEIFRPLFLTAAFKAPFTLTRKDIDEFLYPKFEGQMVDMARAAGWTVAGKGEEKDTDCPKCKSVFLVPEAGENQVTYADLANYAEIVQLEVLGLHEQTYANRPCLKRWADAIKKVPGYDKIHEALFGFINEDFKKLVPQKE